MKRALALFVFLVAVAIPAQSQCNLTYVSESIPGMHMNRNGRITGVPRELADNTVFIRVTDDAGCSLTQAFPVRVNPPM